LVAIAEGFFEAIALGLGAVDIEDMWDMDEGFLLAMAIGFFVAMALGAAWAKTGAAIASTAAPATRALTIRFT
jgi:hypothetical protein